MFDRFSLPARRAVFWARHEAGQLGSETIEPKHLLLGLLMEDQGESERQAVSRFGKPLITPQPGDPLAPFFSDETASKLRQILAKQTSPGAPKAETVDLPLAERAHWALIAANEHAGNAEVQLLHVLWGLISDEKNSVRTLLNANGVTAEQVEDAIHGRPRS
jgi:ATP-dependent Clp protease ATP-binding subunit ClpA